MGVSLSLLPRAWIEVLVNQIHGFKEQVEDFRLKSISFSGKDVLMTLKSLGLKRNDSGTKIASNGSFNFKNSGKGLLNQDTDGGRIEPTFPKSSGDDKTPQTDLTKCLALLASPRPRNELDAAAVKLQKVYKSYRTRRNLADCAVVVEELWWKAWGSASVKHSAIPFFDVEKPETALSRWARARTMAAKVGKGLSKNDKAQKLALRHWLEAIDPRHRYGHNLHLYYDVWFDSESTQPFFYWLDVGDGKEVNLEKCPRSNLQQQCVKYLGPKVREAYEVIAENGKLTYKQSKMLVNTEEGSKWIFVLSTTRALYVGKKVKGNFQHSSFLAGGATIAAGRLVAKEGILKAIWPYSGHYLPTEENFKELINFLEENHVDLTNVQRCSVDDDECPSFKKPSDERTVELAEDTKVTEDLSITNGPKLRGDEEEESTKAELNMNNSKNQVTSIESIQRQACKWTTGAGPRIGCVRDYPTDLQCKALEQVNLSPRIIPSPKSLVPVPSPRPSPSVRLSPRLVYNMGIRTPTISLSLPPNPRKR